MRYGNLLTAVKGDTVLFANVHSLQSWRVVKVRDRRNDPLLPDTYRRRPENVRSTSYVVLRNARSGRLRTVYNAECMNAVIYSL